jgi:hypothetical protein
VLGDEPGEILVSMAGAEIRLNKELFVDTDLLRILGIIFWYGKYCVEDGSFFVKRITLSSGNNNC